MTVPDLDALWLNFFKKAAKEPEGKSEETKEKNSGFLL